MGALYEETLRGRNVGGELRETRSNAMGDSRQSILRGAVAVGFATALAIGVPAQAQSADDAEYRRVFEQLLEKPTDPDLNLRYARMAVARGELRKAMAAYERVLAADPGNEAAEAGLRSVRIRLDPPLTRFTVLSGAQYESNARRERRQTGNTHDATLFVRADVSDDRSIGDLRWRTLGEVYANYHPRFHDIDYGNVNAHTGPVVELDKNLRVHFFAGGGYSWITRRTFFVETTAGMTLEFDIVGPLRDVQIRWGYDFVGHAFSTRDATYVDISPRFQFSNILIDKSLTIISPYWRYSGVTGSGPPGVDPRNQPFPARSHQFGLRADYFIQLREWLALDFFVTYEYRHFFETTLDKAQKRRDHTVVPGVQAIVAGLAKGRADLILHYSYDYRATNDGPQRYQNHTAGVRVLWRF
jgi:hypothetical protein